LQDLDTQEKARLFATGTGGLYLLVSIIVVGLAVIRPDIDSGAAALVLTRPVSRAEYVVGRYLGSTLTLFVTLGIMGAGSFVVVLASGHVDFTLLYAFFVLACNGAVILAVMTLLAILAGTIGAAILGFVTYYIAGEIPLVLALVRADVVTGPMAGLLRLFAVMVPHVMPSPLTAGDEVYLSDSTVFVLRGPAWFDWALALAWIAGSLAVAIWELRRREL
jgi:Cu-processing system permease protein